MRRYHVRVTLLTLGVVLGFGIAVARYGFGYRMGPGGHGLHHGHRHHPCHCACDDERAAPPSPAGVQSGAPSDPI